MGYKYAKNLIGLLERLKAEISNENMERNYWDYKINFWFWLIQSEKAILKQFIIYYRKK